MKSIKSIRLIIILFYCFISNFSFSQKTINNILISNFETPYEMLTVLIDGDEVDFNITSGTQFENNKSKRVNVELFSKGCEVNLTYIIDKRRRIATHVILISNINAGKETFTGVFELLEDDLAYIDGRKVKLAQNTNIDCSGKGDCGCSNGMTYLDFNEVRIGDFIAIGGLSNKGTVLANSASVCKNKFTDTDRALREAVENSYNSNGTHSVSAPAGIIVPPNSLYQGNIVIGDLEYKLLDDIRIQGYVNMVGNRIIPEYARDENWQSQNEIFFRFYVIDNPIPNAFAFPNGMVFIHTGLLQIIENEAQLACVIGHEIAHVTYEHASSRYKNQGLLNSEMVKSTGNKLISGFVRAVKDKAGIDQGSLSEGLLDGVAKGISLSRPNDISNLFEKSKETQADRVGLFYAYLAGYDIREAANFWKLMSERTSDPSFQTKMREDTKYILSNNVIDLDQNFFATLTENITSQIVDNFLETIYMSHPLTETRLKDINQLILTNYESEDFTKFTSGQEEYNSFVSDLKY